MKPRKFVHTRQHKAPLRGAGVRVAHTASGSAEQALVGSVESASASSEQWTLKGDHAAHKML